MRKVNKSRSGVLSIIMSLILISGNLTNVFAETLVSTNKTTTEKIAPGIEYTNKAITINDSATNTSLKESINIITADVSRDDVGLITTKAKGIIRKGETVSDQINREEFNGNKVVAGINGDLFSTSTFVPMGLQIKDGRLLTSFGGLSDENIYPIFGINQDKKPFIEYLSFKGKITLLDINNNDTATNVAIDLVNKDAYNGKLNVFTKEYSQTAVDLSALKTSGQTVYAVVKGGGVSEPLKIGQDYIGTVESVVSDMYSVIVPQDGFVIAANSTKGTWMKTNLKAGSKIKINEGFVNKNTPTIGRNDIVEAMGSYMPLVRDGIALTADQMATSLGATTVDANRKIFANGTGKARTAIGITKDNKVIAVTVDGGQPSIGKSEGATLPQLARILAENGAVQAVNLDGGGSTQMNVKRFGSNNDTVANLPSDGSERVITSSILFVSKVDKVRDIGEIKLGEDISIYKKTKYKFNPVAVDKNNNAFDLSNLEANWNAETAAGDIDSTGLFTAANSIGNGRVTFEAEGVSTSSKVNVVDKINSLKIINAAPVVIEQNKSIQFNIEALDENNNKIIIDNNAFTWTVDSSLGKVDENGVFTAGSNKGQGDLTVSLGDKTEKIKIIVGKDAFVIDDMEHNDNSRYSINGYIGGIGVISDEQAKSGEYSYKIQYDTATWAQPRPYNGTINFNQKYIDKNGNDIKANYVSDIKPKRLGMWIYGDGRAPWLRAIIVGGDNQSRTLDLASKIDWLGWKYVDVEIKADIPAPVRLSYIYMVETDKSANYSGAVYIDDIRFSYSDDEDLKAPDITNVTPSGTIYGKAATFSAQISDNKSGVDEKSIKATLDGNDVILNYNKDTGYVTYDAKNLSEGTHTITIVASDKAGNTAPVVTKIFNVNLQPDTIAPVVSQLTPLDKSNLKWDSPRISFKIIEAQSGVDVKDINIVLDGANINPYYDEQSGWVYAITDSKLEEGTHILEVSVKDKAGNAAVKENRTFNIAYLKQPKDKNNFKISVTSDTHNTAVGNAIINRVAADDSELVIQNGDLVDTDTPAQWDAADASMGILNNSKGNNVVNNAGNHETMGGNLNNYIARFGNPTYSFEYGNTKLISLNTSFGQSISGTDPTQFDYLEKVLAKNTMNNIIIYTHVTTRDDFGTAHEMLPSDAIKLENILSSYKKANPSKYIQVIFGHLHVSQSWEKDGVNYTISGDGALKKYVSPQDGGFLSYTKFTVDSNSINEQFIPLVSRVAVLDSAINSKNQLTIVKGAERKLNVYGDFTENVADYCVNLSLNDKVETNWESLNPEIVSVNNLGVIKSNSVGEGTIRITISGKTFDQKIVVVDQKEVKPIRVSIDYLTQEIKSKENINLQLTAYDIFGNSFAVDNSLVTWTADKNIGFIDGLNKSSVTMFKAKEVYGNDLEGTIEASYNGKSNSIKVVVKGLVADKTNLKAAIEEGNKLIEQSKAENIRRERESLKAYISSLEEIVESKAVSEEQVNLSLKELQVKVDYFKGMVKAQLDKELMAIKAIEEIPVSEKLTLKNENLVKAARELVSIANNDENITNLQKLIDCEKVIFKLKEDIKEGGNSTEIPNTNTPNTKSEVLNSIDSTQSTSGNNLPERIVQTGSSINSNFLIIIALLLLGIGTLVLFKERQTKNKTEDK